ncbi:bifunctional hydroxymethylpyrimidine kinase/phosphomethylpyrimidine kinase [Butyricicoccus sp. Marseille-Q5471]|uniref:bifunctional hydroxymethylpyrimidine kinase/phosphomethylpyrimidine kinase n=1 Tax=Butyricicoccus sp. Marseille-Q5471 TaxID=3039493 RepID=UPI0024BD5407|nr:bifunctional hydroxymethylpyrimidine kinase/phosphomethylpyrimidine kinase [Butyricicoccus sp. Marseille-Q5471]
MKTVLTIAGSDCSGGAGIQADLKTVEAHRLYGMSVITALTAQNTTGVYGVAPTEPDFVARQIDCVFEDIRPDAVKLGMLVSAEIIEVVADRMRAHHAANIVLDPVMVSTSGHRLLSPDAIDAMTEQLLPMAQLITPNLAEAAVFCGFPIHNRTDMLRAANALSLKTAGDVLIKGGHLQDSADDLLLSDTQERWFNQLRVENSNTHGTGCTLSSAIACQLAQGHSVVHSVELAKHYLTACLQAGLDLGHGSGPLQHSIPPEHCAQS